MRAPLGLTALGLVGGVLCGDHAPAWLWLGAGTAGACLSVLGLRRKRLPWGGMFLLALATGALRQAMARESMRSARPPLRFDRRRWRPWRPR